MPKISIVVPVYKVEDYLEECVESLIHQTLKDIEIILVDDESPDNCPRMCDHYAVIDNRIKVVHKKNGGLGFARNSGMAVATGDYVTFVDSDDHVSKDTYQYLFERHSDVDFDVLYYRFVKYGNPADAIERKESDIVIYNQSDIRNLKLEIIASDSKRKEERRVPCSACTSIYKRAVIEQYGLQFHSERELVSEDLVFNLDFLTVSNCACVDNSVLYFYRYNENSLTHTVDQNKLGRFDIYDQYLRTNIERWRLSGEANNRISRLLIGYYRSAIISILTSNIAKKDKKTFYTKALKSETLQNAIDSYPWRDYAMYQKLFFLSMKHQIFMMSSLLSKIRAYKTAIKAPKTQFK